jgi:pyruvate-formate lyase
MTTLATDIKEKAPERVQRLKALALSLEDDKDPIERALLVTESYKKTESLPPVLRRAMALAHILDNETVKIFDDESIVGMTRRRVHCHVGLIDEYDVAWTQVAFPEWNGAHMVKNSNRTEFTPEVKEALSYWHSRPTPVAMGRGYATEEQRKAMGKGVMSSGGWLNGHSLPSFPLALEKGMNGIKADAEERLEKLELTKADGVKQKPFLEAVVIVCDAAARYGRRYAEEARRLARIETDEAYYSPLKMSNPQIPLAPFTRGEQANSPLKSNNSLTPPLKSNNPLTPPLKSNNPLTPPLKRGMGGFSGEARKVELQRIATICDKVPAEPAETFREAMQSVWFTHIISELEMGATVANSLGRLDQYLYPYYENDLASGLTTREEAQELMDCLWVKLYRTYNDQHIMIGGLKPDGTDGTNDISFMCLQSMKNTRLPTAMGARIHKDTPDEFLLEVCDVLKLSLGRPDLWNDEITVESLVRKGIRLEDARDYAVVGCVELVISGKSNTRTMGHQINLLKCLELALNDGKCQISGEQTGPRGERGSERARGRAGEGAREKQEGREERQEFSSEAASRLSEPRFSDFEALREAYREQASYFIRLAIEVDVRDQVVQSMYFPYPFLSALTENCVEKGKDITNGGTIYNRAGVNLFGISNVANSLAAIKKLVFEHKSLSLDELSEALKANFEDNEGLRQRLLNTAPKYGNDDDYVDAIAREEAEFYCREVGKYRTAEDEPFHPLIFSATTQAIYEFGPKTGASADGRRAGDHLTINVDPARGTDLKGITASVKSVAKLNYLETPGGISHIIDVHPSAVAGPEGTEKLASVIKTYFQQGGMEIGVNIFGEKELRDAQKHPEKYRNLCVRVFGFSTQFINLSPELQEYVIARTKHIAQ